VLIIRANEVSSAELSHLVRACARDLLGQTRFDEFLRHQDVCLSHSYVAATPSGEYAGVALMAERRSHLHLCILAVREEWRSQGLGGSLLEAILSDTGPRPLSLDVSSRNARALAMYYYHGFRLQSASFFWYRPLPIRWEDTFQGNVRAISPDIALSKTETPHLAWPIQYRSILRRLPTLRGIVYMNQGVATGWSLFYAGLDKIIVYRLAAADGVVVKALLRYMHLVTPSASAIFMRWMQGEDLSRSLKEIGFRCYSEYYTLQIN